MIPFIDTNNFGTYPYNYAENSDKRILIQGNYLEIEAPKGYKEKVTKVEEEIEKHKSTISENNSKISSFGAEKTAIEITANLDNIDEIHKKVEKLKKEIESLKILNIALENEIQRLAVQKNQYLVENAEIYEVNKRKALESEIITLEENNKKLSLLMVEFLHILQDNTLIKQKVGNLVKIEARNDEAINQMNTINNFSYNIANDNANKVIEELNKYEELVKNSTRKIKKMYNLKGKDNE